jgi:hypothetical protein
MNADITERKQAERERERPTAQLRILNAELEERVRIRTSALDAQLVVTGREGTFVTLRFAEEG